jgi:hypothetical protein
MSYDWGNRLGRRYRKRKINHSVGGLAGSDDGLKQCCLNDESGEEEDAILFLAK